MNAILELNVKTSKIKPPLDGETVLVRRWGSTVRFTL